MAAWRIEADLRNEQYVYVRVSAACDVQNVKAYESGCLVSTCNTGWKVSEDTAKCVANTCSCLNGIGSTGAKCVSAGANICESCNAGFKLVIGGDIGVDACPGVFAHIV